MARFLLLSVFQFRPLKSVRWRNKDLTPEEQETFKGAYAFRFLFNHLDEEIKKLGANLDMMVDGNHAYDTLQLILLEKENRILITNEKTFHNSRERVPRIMRWVDFKNSYLAK